MKKQIITLSFIAVLISLFSGCSTIEDTMQTIDDNVHKNSLASEKQSSDAVLSYESPEMKTRRAELDELLNKTKSEIVTRMGNPTSKTFDKETDREVYTYRNYKKGNNRIEFHFEKDKVVKWVFFTSKI